MHLFAVDFSYFETKLPSQLRDGLFRILKESACCFLAVDTHTSWTKEFLAWAATTGFDASDFVFNEISGPHAERMLKPVSIPSEYQQERCTTRRIARSAKLLHEVSVLAARKSDFRDLECDLVSVFDSSSADMQMQIKCPIHIPIPMKMGFFRFGDSSGGVDPDAEYLAILEASKNPGVYRLDCLSIKSQSLEDFIEQVLANNLNIIHICGHVVMIGNDPVIDYRIGDTNKQISLKNLIKAISSSNIDIVVVNTCYSVLEMLHDTKLRADHVGHQGEIAEEIARKFSSVFYRSLITEGNITKSAALARKAIQSDGSQDFGKLVIGRKAER